MTDLPYQAHLSSNPLSVPSKLPICTLYLAYFSDSDPNPFRFEWDVPGWDFVLDLSRLIEFGLSTILQVTALILAIYRQSSPEREILLALCLAHLLILIAWHGPLRNGNRSPGV